MTVTVFRKPDAASCASPFLALTVAPFLRGLVADAFHLLAALRALHMIWVCLSPAPRTLALCPPTVAAFGLLRVVLDLALYAQHPTRDYVICPAASGAFADPEVV